MKKVMIMMMHCEFHNRSYTEVSGRVRILTGCTVVSWYEALFKSLSICFHFDDMFYEFMK